MCAKYEDISPPASPLPKLPLLSPQEMRDVLTEFLEEPSVPQDEADVQRFIGVISDLPDLEGDCSILSLGWNEDLGGEGRVISEETRDLSNSNTTIKTGKVEKESAKKEISCWSKVKAREKVLPDPVQIQKGDLVEYLVEENEDKIWFMVEVTGRGKAGGKNRNYLNVKYSDGSEGGVFIEKHQWRIVNSEEVLEEWRANLKLSNSVVGDPISIGDNVERETSDKVSQEDTFLSQSDVAADSSTAYDKIKEKRKERTHKNSESIPKLETSASPGPLKKTSEDVQMLNSDTKGDPASLIKKGDVLEYLVVEEGDVEDIWFLVEVLGKGKAGGKNRNYLNVRYSDASEGGVFIDKHQWRIVRRADAVKVKAQSEQRDKTKS